MDIVFIEGLQIEALIGIYDWERRIRQPLVFDLEMQFDNTIPAASDAIADTLDYKAVSKRLIEFVGQSGFGLVETLAERVAAIVLDEFGVERVRLKLSKPGAVRGARAVGVMIERTRQPGAPRRLQATPAEVGAPVVPAMPVAATAPEIEAAAFAAAVPSGGAAPAPNAAETPATAAVSDEALSAATGDDADTRVETDDAIDSTIDDAITNVASEVAQVIPEAEAVASGDAAPSSAVTATDASPAPEATETTPATDVTDADAVGTVDATPAAVTPAAIEAAARDDANAPSPLEAALLAAVSGWHSPRPAPSGLDAALSALGEKGGKNGRKRKHDTVSHGDDATAQPAAAVEPPALPAVAPEPAPGPASEPPAMPAQEPVASTPARPRANFMQDLDQAPVRPVSVAATAAAAPARSAPAEPEAGSLPEPAALASVEPPPLPVDAAASPALPPAPATPAAPSRRTAPPPPPRPRNPASDLGRTTRPAYLSLGSNIEPEKNLRSALMALRARFGEVIVSPVYRMTAVGFDGPEFLNAAVIIDSDLDPFALTRWLHGIETAHGRMRSHVKNSSRTLDMDIIFFDDLVLDMPGGLQLPRPELRHAFVLKPLVDIAPGFIDPVRGVPLADVWAAHKERETKFSTVMI